VALKMPLKSNSRYPFSYKISLSETFCQIPSCCEHRNSRFLDLYFREFTAAINFPRSKSRLRIGVNDVILIKYHTVEITITIDTTILIKNNKKLCSYIRAVFYINCDYNFNPWSIFESMMSFTSILNQGKLMAAVNSLK